MSDTEVRTHRTSLDVAMFALALLFFALVLLIPDYAFASVPLLVAAAIVLRQLSHRWRLARRVDLCANASGLSLGGRVLVARRAIRSACIFFDQRSFVRLERWPHAIDIVLQCREDGEDLIAALGLDASHSTARYRVYVGNRRQRRARMTVMLLAYLAVHIPWSIFSFGAMSDAVVIAGFILLVSGACAVAAREPIVLFVGADGIRLERALSRTRFLHYQRIQSVERMDTCILLHPERGRTLCFSLGSATRCSERLLCEDAEYQAADLIARISAGLGVHRAAKDSALHTILAKGGRSTSEWLRGLRGSVKLQPAFRGPAIPPEMLWTVAEDPAAPPTARVGAAMLLRGELDTDARAQLRTIAEGCADSRLRVALERVADAVADHALTKAVGEVDDAPIARPMFDSPLHSPAS